MDPILDEVEVRIVGCLIEKESTTPETYPLTLNALTRACNQKSNRNPIVAFDEKAVVRTLDELSFNRKLVRRVIGDDSRVPKYRHTFGEAFDLNREEMAILCVLMLRGPQTVGEIRGRTERLHPFETLEQVETVLQRLMEREDPPLVTRLPRQPGTKEARYAHLLSGEVQQEAPELLEPAALEVRAENERIADLEREIESLRAELQELQQAFVEFRKQFE